MSSLALVESPFQLLSLVEAIDAGVVAAAELDVIVRTDVAAARSLFHLLERQQGIRPRRVTTSDSPAALVQHTRAADRLVLGDVFSGLGQLLLVSGAPTEVVLLDDGASTLRAHEALRGEAELVRPRERHGRGRSLLAAAATAVLRRLADRDHLRVVSAFGGTDVDVIEHHFAWSRRIELPLQLEPRRCVIVGSALAADGLVDRSAYHDWIAERSVRRDSYFFAHRREEADTVAFVRRLGVATVDTGGLPAELCVRDLPPGSTFHVLPATMAITIPLIRGSHVGVRCAPVPGTWWLDAASQDLRSFVGSIAVRATPADGVGRGQRLAS